MGNQRQKPPEQLQGRGSRYRGTSSITLLRSDAKRVIPRCPSGLTDAARAWYAAFCKDPISQMVTAAAWPKVQRLATLLAKREVIEKRIWEAPTVEGSMGQPTINPLISLLKELNREIEKIEGGLGLLPQDRMRLGLATTQHISGVAELRARLDQQRPMTEDIEEMEDGGHKREIINLDALL